MKRFVVSLLLSLCLISGYKTEARAYDFSDEEKGLLAKLAFAEAEAECVTGQRMVIDTVLNRMDHEKFPDTVKDVIYEKKQFGCVWNGRFKRSEITDELLEIVDEEIEARYCDECLFFTSGFYGKSGEPLYKMGNHYFSTLEDL